MTTFRLAIDIQTHVTSVKISDKSDPSLSSLRAIHVIVPTHPFIIGGIYNRRLNIHGPFKGQQQGGISTPASVPYIFAFTSDSGAAYGYHDKPGPDGTFWYTGEGQTGDMQMVRGNEAIASHAAHGKIILLFEYQPDNNVRFLGEVECLGHHTELRPDRNGVPRVAIIFHLGFLAPIQNGNQIQTQQASYTALKKLPSKLSLAQLRALALTDVPSNATQQQKVTNVALRSEAIKRYALARSNGNCEGCTQPAPFLSKKGPFLEVHHVFRLSDGGPDHPANVIALCPNCHRRAHHAIDSDAFNNKLINWLAVHEIQ
ncbi:TPA: HNH endonuclease [Aeromonas salmonicida]|nr:HNH endonuclease [Aeromonas salmonicida]